MFIRGLDDVCSAPERTAEEKIVEENAELLKLNFNTLFVYLESLWPCNAAFRDQGKEKKLIKNDYEYSGVDFRRLRCFHMKILHTSDMQGIWSTGVTASSSSTVPVMA